MFAKCNTFYNEILLYSYTFCNEKMFFNFKIKLKQHFKAFTYNFI